MKFVLAALLLGVSVLAQAQQAGLRAACGAEKASFKVELDGTQHTPAAPEPGKAQVYILRDDGVLGGPDDIGYPTIKIGMDGTWVGANEGNSWFVFSVEPGEHGMCASVQSGLDIGHILEFAHFTAEAGKTYYFRTRFTITKRQAYLNFDPADSDQGKYMIAAFPLSTWRAKK
jgi:hypothetical protein